MAETPELESEVPVEVLCLSVTPALIRKGRVTRDESGFYDVVLDESDPAFHSGMRVILDGGPDSSLRVDGLVTESSGIRLRIETAREIRPEKRAFPRLYGGIRARYHVLPDREAATVAPAWLAGDNVPDNEAVWHEPDPFMDFSGTGLKFEDLPHCQVHDLLLMEIQVPPGKDTWRATARVVRIEAISQEEGEEEEQAQREERKSAATHRIAINFLDMPEELSTALAAFTLRIQDALLRT